MENRPIVIFCTVPDLETAKKIATKLVEEKLAACCNVIDGLISIYSWQNKMESDNELLLIIKTLTAKFDTVKDRIKELHPYQTPEIIGTDFPFSDNKYLQWIVESTG